MRVQDFYRPDSLPTYPDADKPVAVIASGSWRLLSRSRGHPINSVTESALHCITNIILN